MKYINRVVCAAVAVGMVLSFAGCKNENEVNETEDAASNSVTENIATSDTPSLALKEYKIGNITFKENVTELQLGDVTFTEDDLKTISKCTNLEYFGVLSSNLTDLEFLSGLPKLKTVVIGTSDMKNLSSISGLDSLENLSIINANLTSLNGMENLSKLKNINFC